MKSIIFAIASIAFAGIASAAILDKEVSAGNGKKICIYSDGSTITMSEMRFCPMSK